MKRLGLELKNCHGIRELDASFKFKNGNSVAVLRSQRDETTLLRPDSR